MLRPLALTSSATELTLAIVALSSLSLRRPASACSSAPSRYPKDCGSWRYPPCSRSASTPGCPPDLSSVRLKKDEFHGLLDLLPNLKHLKGLTVFLSIVKLGPTRRALRSLQIDIRSGVEPLLELFVLDDAPIFNRWFDLSALESLDVCASSSAVLNSIGLDAVSPRLKELALGEDITGGPNLWIDSLGRFP